VRYDVTVIAPRSAFAAEGRFPGVTMMTQWPAAALAAFGLDRRSALVSLTHDPKIDDPALASALRSDAFYIGALGSRKTHAARLARLREQGFGDAELARIHAPVGLPIGAVAPAEIAVSILAEITQALRGAPLLRRQTQIFLKEPRERLGIRPKLGPVHQRSMILKTCLVAAQDFAHRIARQIKILRYLANGLVAISCRQSNLPDRLHRQHLL